MWNEFFERVLAVEAAGGMPDRLSVVVPSIVRPAQPFTVKVAALDAHGYPSLECDASAVVTDGAVSGPQGIVLFEEGRPAVGQTQGLVPEEGLFRVGFEFDGRTWLSNPVRCDAAAEERIFWGDPHVHTLLSNCIPDRCRSLEFAYVCGRYATGLDWISVTDHVSGGRSDPGKWKTQRAAAEAFHDPPYYVTLLGYEASLKGGAGGDNNVYLPGDAEAYADVWDEEGNLRDLSEGLGDQDCLVVPHHTSRAIKHGELSDELYLGRERMPVVEIYSKWGASEYLGNPNALNKPHTGPSYVQDFLASGYPFGFIGGTDTHATMPSGWGEESEHVDRMPAFTAVRAPALSRSAVYTNLRRRNCYATSGERILLDVSTAGAPMGTEIPWPDAAEPRTITARTAAETDIVSIDVVRNGEDIYSERGHDWELEFEWTDEESLTDVAFAPRGGFDRPFVYYYLRVTCESGAQAWTSPVWLTL